MKIISSAYSSQKSDKATIEKGISSVKLMLNAGKSIFAYLTDNMLFNNLAIICGCGNNGGDGFCVAYLLLEKGINATVYAFKGELSTDAKYFYDKFKALGGKVNYIDKTLSLKNFKVIVDAIFGTGINRHIDGIYFDIIKQINNSNAKVVSCDIPSGLNADNGNIMGISVKAETTITFGTAKLGHYLGQGRDLSGKLIVADIGVDAIDKSMFLIEKADCKNLFKPYPINVHKGNLGKGGIIGGSKNFIGASLLAYFGDCALRVGSGLSYLGVPDCIYEVVASRVINNIVYPFKSKGGVIVYDEEALNNFLSLDAIAIGMGLGKCDDVNKILFYIIKNSKAKLVFDADVLNLLDTNILKHQKNKVLITPHPKEFARLLNCSVDEVLDNPIELSKGFAKKYNITVLLKGATTVITDGKKVAFNIKGTSGMAKGGSGDLLDGIILGLLARGFDIFESACVGSLIAGLSAELAYTKGKINNFSMLASDRVDYIGQAINKIIDN